MKKAIGALSPARSQSTTAAHAHDVAVHQLAQASGHGGVGQPDLLGEELGARSPIEGQEVHQSQVVTVDHPASTSSAGDGGSALVPWLDLSFTSASLVDDRVVVLGCPPMMLPF